MLPFRHHIHAITRRNDRDGFATRRDQGMSDTGWHEVPTHMISFAYAFPRIAERRRRERRSNTHTIRSH